MEDSTKSLMDNFTTFARFLSAFLGPDVEIVLYSVPENCVYSVINPLDPEMTSGSKIRRLEQSLINEKVWKKDDFFVNYRSLSSTNAKLKSATYFIASDDRKELYGIITINMVVDKLLELRDHLNQIITGYAPLKDERRFLGSVTLSVDDMVSTSIDCEIKKYGVDGYRLSAEEKLDIVKNLDKKGIFLVKGAISELAEKFGTTETTVYRYINRLT